MNFAPSSHSAHSHSPSNIQRLPSYPSNRHRQHSAPAQPTHRQYDHPHRTASQESNTLEFTSRRLNKQPLYRPAALRRNNTQEAFNSDQLLAQLSLDHTPPRSPALSLVEPSGGWLGSLSSWTTNSNPGSRQVSPEMFDGSEITGVMCSREDWKPDEQALICADSQCTLRFGLLERRHHCRQCGQVFCASHSSRNTLLWQSPADTGVPLAFSTPPTPNLTPRSTPRRALSRTPSYSASASEGSQTPTISGSPPQAQAVVLPGAAMPMSVRVCDACFFSAPNKAVPLMSPPIGTALGGYANPSTFSFASNSSSASLSTATHSGPLTFRASSRHRTPVASPACSPPSSTASPALGSGSAGVARRASRSRQNSAHTTSSSLDSHRSGSTPPTSVDGQSKESLRCADYRGSHKVRGVSPATSIRRAAGPVATVPSFPEESSDLSDTDEESDDDDDEGEGGGVVADGPKVGIFGSVANGWATF